MINYIELDTRYEFNFSEEKGVNKHPLKNYYLSINDLSINSIITLKWLKWGFFFYQEMIKELENISKNIEIDKVTENSINKIFFEKKKKILIIDNNVVKNEDDLNNLIKNFYDPNIFSENSKIHINLKLNINEFLIIDNYLYPELIMYTHTEIINR